MAIKTANWLVDQVPEAQGIVTNWPPSMTAMTVPRDVCFFCKGEGMVHSLEDESATCPTTYSLPCPSCNGTGHTPRSPEDGRP